MIVNIQYLRAFAAIVMVLDHVIYRAESYGQTPAYFDGLKGIGAIGVDIFFNISGFVAFYSQSVHKKSGLSFMKARLIRIIPMYWLLTLTLVGIFLLFPSLFRTLNPELGHTIFSLLFLSQAVIGNVPLIDSGWSLEWQIFFYLVFAATLGVSARRQLLFVSAVLLSVVLISSSKLFVLEFLSGAIATQLLSNERLKGFGTVFLAIGFLLLAGQMLIDVNMDRLFVRGIPAFLIVLGAASMRERRNQLLQFLGASSYSIYLVQAGSIPLFYKLSSKLFTNIQGDLLALACLAASIAAGMGLYWAVETPLTSFVRQSFAWKPQLAFSSRFTRQPT